MFKLLIDGFVLKKLLEWRWCGRLWMQCWMSLKGQLSGHIQHCSWIQASPCVLQV